MTRTVRDAVVVEGAGLHGGQPVAMRIRPAAPGTGIRFRRTDVAGPGSEVPASYALVSDTRLCTRLGNAQGVSVGTVEHVMAALAGLGITDVAIELDGPEVPILDGSARGVVGAISAVGLTRSDAPLRAIRIEKPVEVARDGRLARLLPAERTEISFEISFDDPAIGEQALELALTGDAFVAELADCRTFGRLEEVEALRRMGLARGGSLENAIVVDRGRVLNPGGLRRPDEFVRHKMLDALGDLALAGAPILGRYEGVRAGHEMTNLLLRALFADPDAWSWGEAGPESVPHASAAAPETARPARALAV